MATTIPFVEDVRIAFGRRVRALRKQSGFSQEELAHRVGVHVTYLSGVERGERNLALLNITRLANALDVSLAKLFADLSGRFQTPPIRRR